MRLKHYLDRFIDTFPREEHLARDPVHVVRLYTDPADREVVGFLAAALAYGNVRAVLASVRTALGPMGAHPGAFVREFDPRRDAGRFRGFVHRWTSDTDLVALLWILRRLLEESGSIEAAVAGGLSEGDGSVYGGIERLSRVALGFGHERWYPATELDLRRGVRYFFPQASAGSACKRLNLYLRWMVRPDDGVDCGVWTRIRPDQLIIPLDTHIARISRYIGLTDYRSPGWRMAEDITRSLRRLDGADPIRYDFALCHLGIAGDCPRKRDRVKCRSCPIRAVCRL